MRQRGLDHGCLAAVRYTGLSERTALDRLEADGIIRSCGLAVVAAKIKRAGQRPQGWTWPCTWSAATWTTTS
jgi:hypothetical protein